MNTPKQNLTTDVLGDMPRGRDANFIGMPPQSYFEPTRNLMATESLRFDPHDNRASKWFLGVCDAQVVSGPPIRRPCQSLCRPAGRRSASETTDTIVLIAGSRAGKGRSVLIPNLICLPDSTSILCIDPKGDLARHTCRYRADGLGSE